MKMNEKDMIKKKLLDAQEMVRDFEMFSKKTRDTELAQAFEMFAEESGKQAQKLQKFLKD